MVYDLEEYKQTLQNIIDKYLPKNSRFSVKDFNQEEIYYLASLFLEKDPQKRKKIYDEIEMKQKLAKKEFEDAERSFLEMNNEIIMKKNKYDRIFGTIRDLDELFGDIEVEQELNTDLKTIF